MHDVAPDGSPVTVYLAVPPEPDLSPVLAEISAPGSVLDLGCGVGRLADTLAARGLEVTGVDESEAMLSHVSSDVRTVTTRIEHLELGRTFDHVVLASQLVNSADPIQRAELLTSARRHVAPRGQVHIQHLDAASDLYEASTGPRTTRIDTQHGPLELRFEVLDRVDLALSAVVEYRLNDEVFRQRFDAVLLDDDALRAELEAHDLRPARRLDARWLVAEPAARGS